MRHRQSATILADAETVWPHLADPVLHANWNPRVVSIDRALSGPVRVGERFQMLYRFSRRSGGEEQHGVEVTAVEAPHRVRFLHTAPRKRTEQVIEETYEITPAGEGVKVVQTVNLSRAGIPWPFRVLMWVIFRFGWNAETPFLERLKRQIEQPADRATDGNGERSSPTG